MLEKQFKDLRFHWIWHLLLQLTLKVNWGFLNCKGLKHICLQDIYFVQNIYHIGKHRCKKGNYYHKEHFDPKQFAHFCNVHQEMSTRSEQNYGWGFLNENSSMRNLLSLISYILYQSYTSPILVIYQSYISQISVIYQSYISHMSVIFQSYISPISVIYQLLPQRTFWSLTICTFLHVHQEMSTRSEQNYLLLDFLLYIRLISVIYQSYISHMLLPQHFEPKQLAHFCMSIEKWVQDQDRSICC